MKVSVTVLVAVMLVLVGLGVTAYAVWRSFGRVTVEVHRMYTCYLTVEVSEGAILRSDVKCVPQSSSKHAIEWGKLVPLSSMFYHLPKVMLRLTVMDLRSDSPTYTYYSKFRVTATIYGVPSGTHNAFLQVLQTDQNGQFRETSESTITINAGVRA